MSKVDIKVLFESGAHFGHKTSRWHPKMAQYIHSDKNGVHIIDLTKTADLLEVAGEFLKKTASSGKQILLVGTKRQAKDIVTKAASEIKMPYVSVRWFGGLLTNLKTMQERIKHLKNLEKRMESGELANRYNKLEVQRFQEEIDQLNHNFGGIKELDGKPAAVVVLDVVGDKLAVSEANKLDIPVVGIVDTNADPSLVDYPIPANDDATKTLQLIMDYLAQSITEGVSSYKPPAPVVKTAAVPVQKTEVKTKEPAKKVTSSKKKPAAANPKTKKTEKKS